MSRISGSFVLLFAAVAAASPLHAQTGRDLRVGDRIRIVAPSLGDTATVAEVAEVHGDAFVLESRALAAPVRVSRAEITRLEVSRGRPSYLLRGAVAGAVAGGATMFAVTSGARDCEYVCGAATTAGTIGGTLLGGVVGGLLGSAFHHGPDRWRAQEVHPTVAIAPSRRGTALTFTIPTR
jgi:hypothetical protein